MKYKIVLSPLLMLLVASLYSQASLQDTVIVNADIENVYQYRNFIIAGQPDMKALKWYKKEGYNKIINLRSEDEMKEFAEEEFDEAKKAKKMGFEYVCVPISGYDTYTPENLGIMSEAINSDEKTIIHCRSGGRATHLFMAYLVNSGSHTVNEAALIGKQMRFVLPLELLLDREIILDLEQ